jgi:hypothetical protein
MFRFRSLLRWCFELLLVTLVGALGYQLWRSRRTPATVTAVATQPGRVVAETPVAQPRFVPEKTAALVQTPADTSIVLDIREIDGDGEALTVYDLVPRRHHHHY